MPNFLVTLPESNTMGNQTHGAKSMVIFAADAAGARRAAEGRLDGDGNVQWSDSGVATVTELVVGTELADAGDDEGWTGFCRITGAAAQDDIAFAEPIILEADGLSKNFAAGRLGATRLHLDGALNDGGIATYVVDEILTAAGGTFTRAATFRVITVSTGVITALELVDPGEYSVLPATMTANPVTGGGGTGALVDLTQWAENSYEAILAQMVTQGVAAGMTSSIDLSEGALGTRLLTLATIGDDIGDGTVTFEIRHNGTAETVAVSTIVDEGIAAAVLTVAAAAIGWAPPRIHVFQNNPL